MTGWYLGSLLVSLAGIVVIDMRWRLALFARERGARALTVAVTLVGAAGFLVWDAVAISRGHFGRGASEALLGVEVAPHLPVEELVFVTFLSYLTLVLFGGAMRLVSSGAASGRES